MTYHNGCDNVGPVPLDFREGPQPHVLGSHRCESLLVRPLSHLQKHWKCLFIFLLSSLGLFALQFYLSKGQRDALTFTMALLTVISITCSV
jgi:hypothetical protein